MTDIQLNDYIGVLLDVSLQERLSSNGLWAEKIESAMALWSDRHPGTLPPVYEKLGPPPSCFKGTIPPIYEGELE